MKKFIAYLFLFSLAYCPLFSQSTNSSDILFIDSRHSEFWLHRKGSDGTSDPFLFKTNNVKLKVGQYTLINRYVSGKNYCFVLDYKCSSEHNLIIKMGVCDWGQDHESWLGDPSNITCNEYDIYGCREDFKDLWDFLKVGLKVQILEGSDLD
jgi:hypothetical protein